jgi:hypothetical protein
MPFSFALALLLCLILLQLHAQTRSLKSPQQLWLDSPTVATQKWPETA